MESDGFKAQNFAAVWGTDPDHVFAVGSHRAVALCDRSSYRALAPLGMPNLTAVRGTDADHVFAVGEAGTILQCSASAGSCVSQASGTGQNLSSISSSSGGISYAVGAGGTILQHLPN